nr:hypothetical protein [Tanacetum cinerariifolium]
MFYNYLNDLHRWCENIVGVTTNVYHVGFRMLQIDSEPGRVFWGADEELSDRGSPLVIVYGYDGLPMQLVALPSPDYIPGPEEPQTPPVPQYEDKQDEHVLLAEEQSLPPIDSPTAESPGYVVESDPEEDPEEYEDDEIEDSPVDYPIDGGDDGDDDDGNSYGDDTDDEDKDEEDEKDEEEHLAQADSAIVIPTVELAAIFLPPEAEVERLLAMPTPPPSPLTSLSPPSAGERLARRITFNTHLTFTFKSKQDMDQQYPTVAKIPIPDTRKFEQWQFRMQQYLQHEHYALWEVIEFGDSYEAPANDLSTTTTNTTSGEAGTKSGRTVTLITDDMQKKKNDVKARTTLLLSLPDEHQLRFSKYKTAQELWAAILKIFGGNEATKKTKKNLLKQQYGNFRAEGSET